MAIFWNLYIFIIELTFGLINGIIYVLVFMLIPLMEIIVHYVLKRLDIQINGNRPWDIKYNNWRAIPNAIAYGSIGVVESYFEGHWDCDDIGKVSNILAKSGLMRLSINSLVHRRLYMFFRWDILNLQTRERAIQNCDTQYNLGKDFYSMFLDKETFTYSIACWGNGANNLQEATYHKMELICQQLDLKAGMRVLDLGCGFGGFSKYMATKYNVNVVGITNSIEMYKGAKERCSGLSNVQINFMDYRDLPINEKFDRVVTIEMLFHVGKQNIPRFFQIVNNLLKEDGLLFVQDFLTLDRFPAADEAISKYIFPGYYLPRFEEIVTQSSKYFSINSYTDLSHDMEKTFRVFYETLEKNWNYKSTKFDNNLLKVLKYFFIGTSGVIQEKLITTYHAVFQKRPQ